MMICGPDEGAFRSVLSSDQFTPEQTPLLPAALVFPKLLSLLGHRETAAVSLLPSCIHTILATESLLSK